VGSSVSLLCLRVFQVTVTRVHRCLGPLLVLAALGSCQRRGDEADTTASVTTPPASKPSPVEAPDASLDASEDAQAIDDAGTGSGSAWICVPPQRGSYPECSKGTSSSEDELRRCVREHPYKPNYVPRFRVANGRWMDVSPKYWTCAPISKTEKVRLTLDTVASWNVSVPSDCASGVIDVEGPNWYNAFWTKCSRRPRTNDVSVAE